MKPTRATPYGLLALDLVSSIVVFNVIAYLRRVETSEHFLFSSLALPVAALVFAIYLVQGYRPRTDMLSVDYTSQHAIALASALLVTLLLTFVLFPAGYNLQASRAMISLSFVALIPLTIGYRRLVYQLLLSARGERCLVFLGDFASCEAFRVEAAKMGTMQKIVFTVISEESVAPFGPDGESRLRPFHEVLEEVRHERIGVDAIILRESARELSPAISRQLVELYFAGVPTYTLELFHQVFWQKIPIYRLNQTWLFQEGFQIAREPVFERLKRVSDISFSCLGLLLAAPFLVVAGTAIWIEDRGPVFFVQSRVGKNHQRFPLVKLRTMRVGGPAGSLYTHPVTLGSPAWAASSGPRGSTSFRSYGMCFGVK
jgi:hypothetical protein